MATVEALQPEQLENLRTHLAGDPVHNLYLLGILEEFGLSSLAGSAPFRFYGRFDKGGLTAAAFVGGSGGLVVPSAGSLVAGTDLARQLTGRVKLGACQGEKAIVEAFQQLLGSRNPKLSVVQRLFSVSADDLGPFTNPLLRLATESDVPRLIPMAAAAVAELLQRDPLAEDPVGFAERVKLRVRRQRTYVLEEDSRLVFKLDVGARSRFGAELEGAYTVPSERNKGHATLCMGQISRFLLSSLPRLTMRIAEDNAAFTTIVRKVGYVPGRSQRLVLNG
jgi:uncharacterized protein